VKYEQITFVGCYIFSYKSKFTRTTSTIFKYTFINFINIEEE
jgi:hypothetical protein